MRIRSIEARREDVALLRPYAIAYQETDAVEIVRVVVRTDDGRAALGAATPEPAITGESVHDCLRALAPERTAWLVGRDVRALPALLRELERETGRAPGARAALDMALHDLFARALDLPLVEVLGRAHDALPTSVTIGILDVERTLEEAREHLGRGFRALKVKVGRALDEDLERLARVREVAGREVALRADANEGWTPEELERALFELRRLDVEFVEQPLPAGALSTLRGLAKDAARLLAADESLHDARQAIELTHPPVPFGTWNVKLMKCGGIAPARDIAAIAAAADIDLMWGCMDESAVGIAAALHVALASPATRHLDLDGSLDLARDFARGGFAIEDGRMRTLPRPGLGVEFDA